MATRKKESTRVYVTELAIMLAAQEDMPAFAREVRFAPGRDWAFDIAWPDLMVAVEYEGNTWAIGGSRHTTGAGYRADIDKYNTAAILGWCVIRITADMVRKGDFYSPVMQAIAVAQAVRYVEPSLT